MCKPILQLNSHSFFSVTKRSRQDCGDDLYADFLESDAESIRDLVIALQNQTVDGGVGTSLTNTTNPHTVEASPNPTTPASTSSQLLPSQGNNVSQALGQKAPSQPSVHTPSSTTRGTTPASGRATGDAGKRFIELCVNTGEFQRQLAEIDISDVSSDGQLFDRIRERYREVRSFRTKYILLKPVDIHFVQFSVEDRHRVGILDKPMAIPSQAEMATEGYGYRPCPLRPLPPIPANIFLHHLLKPTEHRRLLWGNRIPQKLHRSILQAQSSEDLIIGWGVHIIEGLNKITLYSSAFGVMLVSGIVSVAWAVARDDVQGGFGIGAWLASMLGVVVMLLATKWSET